MPGGPAYSKVIRDPIHGYIHLSPLEEQIVNTKIFLRLRGIKQGATADQTYPAHHVDRFSHSLGAMELAGRVIIAALANTSNPLLKDFLERCKNEFGTPNIEKTRSLVVCVVRLSGLLHDLGHLPFSHLSEGAIEPLANSLYKADPDWRSFCTAVEGRRPSLHEFATYKLLKTDIELENVFRKNKMLVTKKLLLRVFDPEPKGIFRTLHDVVSSDVDADRADYLLRDGWTSGIGFGQYDHMRLFESMAICKKDERFMILPTTAALSSVEAFLIERHKLHKWLYYHQHVVLTDLVLIRLLRLFVSAADRAGHTFYRLLPLTAFHHARYLIDDLPFDDNRIWGLLGEAHIRVTARLRTRQKSLRSDEETALKTSSALLRILLFREPLAQPLWKNSSEYETFETEIRMSIAHATGTRPDELMRDCYLLNLYAKLLSQSPLILLSDQRIDKSIEGSDFFLLETEKTAYKPYKVKDTSTGLSSFCFIDKRPRKPPIPLTRLSAMVRSLGPAREREMQLFVYVVRYKRSTESQWASLTSKVRTQVKTHLTGLYHKGVFYNQAANAH